MANILRTNKTVIPIVPLNGVNFSAEEIQAIIGTDTPGDNAYIQTIHLKDGSVIVCNEERLKLNLPLNYIATLLYHGGKFKTGIDVIIGDVLHCHLQGTDYVA